MELDLEPAPDPSRGRRLRTLSLVTAGVVALAVLLRWLAPGTPFAILATVVMVVWMVAVSLALAGWLWRRLTYRVGVRLFLSYLIIGVLPFVIMGCLGAVAGYMAAGQYASVRFGTLLDRTYEELGALAERAVQAPPGQASEVLAQASATPPWSPRHLEWVLVDGPRSAASPGLAEAGSPQDSLRRTWSGPTLVRGAPYAAAARMHEGRWFVVMLPLRDAVLEAARSVGWFEVSLSDSVVVDETAEGPQVTVRLDGTAASAPGTSHAATEAGVAPGSASVPVSRGFMSRRLVTWPRVTEAPLAWPTGELQSQKRVAVVLRTSPAEAWASFMQAPYRLADEVLAGFLALAVFFAVLYGIVVSFAVVMIVSIARSTARLTRGARAVAAGDLSSRIPVKRRDQLGDLAVAFNAMTSAVDRMLKDVADKERLKREMELAREIQQSLLPSTQLQHAGLAVSAHFLPASEVGGDYFDVFTLPEKEVICTVGDVAGHGVSTGLLMAMVKSAMGTLVLEGYRGSELLERLNRLLLQQSVKHRMATLVLASVDAETGEAEVTSCGHPPALLVRADGSVEELLLSSLPLGTRLPVEPASRRVAFPPGSRLVLYSDGLIEAAGPAGTALGAEALAEMVREAAGRTAAELVAAILVGLTTHLGGKLLADDLTILVIERAG